MAFTGRGWRLLVLLAGCGVSAVFGQVDQANQAEARQQMTQDAFGGLVNTASITSSTAFAPASPADPDIGEQILLQPAGQYQPFSAYANTSFYWTSNAELLDYTAGSDTFLTTTVGATYLPYLGNNLFAEFSAESGIYRYARNSDLDFNATSATAGLIYVIRDWGDLTLFARYEYDLLTDRAWSEQIYDSHGIAGGVRKAFILSRAHSVYTALEADFVLGGMPDYALRHEFSWLTGYQLSLTRMVKIDLYYRMAAMDYRFVDRADFNQLIGGGVSLELMKWLSIQAISTLGINSSTEDAYSYFAANLGGGISILVNF